MINRIFKTGNYRYLTFSNIGTIPYTEVCFDEGLSQKTRDRLNAIGYAEPENRYKQKILTTDNCPFCGCGGWQRVVSGEMAAEWEEEESCCPLCLSTLDDALKGKRRYN